MKRFLFIGVLVAVLISVWVGVFRMVRDSKNLSAQYARTARILDALNQENDRVERDTHYFSLPENQEKNVRERFNYKKPGERMIIIVPSVTASTSTR